MNKKNSFQWKCLRFLYLTSLNCSSNSGDKNYHDLKSASDREHNEILVRWSNTDSSKLSYDHASKMRTKINEDKGHPR